MNDLYKEYLNGSKQKKDSKVMQHDDIPFLEKFNKMQLRELAEGINTRYADLILTSIGLTSKTSTI